MDDKRKVIALAAVAGIVAGLTACAGPPPEASVPAGPIGATAPGHEDAGVSKDKHGCGAHDGGSCGARDEHKH